MLDQRLAAAFQNRSLATDLDSLTHSTAVCIQTLARVAASEKDPHHAADLRCLRQDLLYALEELHGERRARLRSPDLQRACREALKKSLADLKEEVDANKAKFRATAERQSAVLAKRKERATAPRPARTHGPKAEMPLTQGHTLVIDEEDLARLEPFIWHTKRIGRKGDEKNLRASMHIRPGCAINADVLLMRPAPGLHVRHLNGDGLNCQRSNLHVKPEADRKSAPTSAQVKVRKEQFQFVLKTYEDWIEKYPESVETYIPLIMEVREFLSGLSRLEASS